MMPKQTAIAVVRSSVEALVKQVAWTAVKQGVRAADLRQ